MARLSSSKVRQAILDSDTPWQANLSPERIALFDENGNQFKFDAAGNKVPPGGATGQAMVKLSDDDFDLGWADGGTGGGGGGMVYKGQWDEDATYSPNHVIRSGDKTWIVVGTENMPTGQLPGVDPGVPSFRGAAPQVANDEGTYSQVVDANSLLTPVWPLRVPQRVALTIIKVNVAGNISIVHDSSTNIDTEFALYGLANQDVPLTHTDDVFGARAGVNGYAIGVGYYHLVGSHHSDGNLGMGIGTFHIGAPAVPFGGAPTTAILGPVAPDDIPDARWELIS